ncbi:MAG TPA: hypothetical protein VF285_12035 [Castellaniella sp.]|uniref:hypothetical protein n=1 Tax=Castellaniella sp. TaxID=1955812 RepID=UPI002F21FD19
MDNCVTVSEIKRRGMAAIEEGLQNGPLHIIKHNRHAAVVLTEEAYRSLTGERPQVPGLSPLQWLFSLAPAGTRSRASLDEELKQERDW